MRRIRIDISLGIAAVSLIGLAGTAVAKDNDPPRFKAEIQLQVANDGRGDTQEFRSMRATPDQSMRQTMRQTEDARPQPADLMAKPPPQMKTEVMMRANGERDRGSEVEARTAALEASRPVDQKEVKPVVEKKPECFGFRTK